MSDLHDGVDSLGDVGGADPDQTVSAGEVGDAVDGDGAVEDAGVEEVIVGEIPDAHNLSHMLWTARCLVSSHGLLGTFESREEAENARRVHLLREHGRQSF
jgi:hypothetical protein